MVADAPHACERAPPDCRLVLAPRRKARHGLPDNARSSAIIDPDEMRTYYTEQEKLGRTPQIAASDS